jgi:hypothetical protein
MNVKQKHKYIKKSEKNYVKNNSNLHKFIKQLNFDMKKLIKS